MRLIARLAHQAAPVLQEPALLQVRRNHALEHAAVNLLNSSGYTVSGISLQDGFYLLGDVPTQSVEAAADAALKRLKAGQRHLALHPFCGTNLVTIALLAAPAAYIGFAGSGWTRGLKRLPLMYYAMLALVLFAQSLGMSLQRHVTTESEVGELTLVSVQRVEPPLPFLSGRVTLHRINTSPRPPASKPEEASQAKA